MTATDECWEVVRYRTVHIAKNYSKEVRDGVVGYLAREKIARGNADRLNKENKNGFIYRVECVPGALRR